MTDDVWTGFFIIFVVFILMFMTFFYVQDISDSLYEGFANSYDRSAVSSSYAK